MELECFETLLLSSTTSLATSSTLTNFKLFPIFWFWLATNKAFPDCFSLLRILCSALCLPFNLVIAELIGSENEATLSIAHHLIQFFSFSWWGVIDPLSFMQNFESLLRQVQFSVKYLIETRQLNQWALSSDNVAK